MSMFDQLALTSAAFPHHVLLQAIHDRALVRLSDRGGASNMIGDRWSDCCFAWLCDHEGGALTTFGGASVEVSAVIRLDDTPAIARAASHKKLRNPDFLVTSRDTAGPTAVQAVDAKFSIETASAGQTEAEALAQLFGIGEVITSRIPCWPDVEAADGLFLTPDMPYTHYILRNTSGRFSLHVPIDTVSIVPIDPASFFKPLPGARFVDDLAALDGLQHQVGDNMLLALYYFRIARGLSGCLRDRFMPVLGKPGSITAEPDLAGLLETAAASERSAWQALVVADRVAETTRAQRQTISRLASPPIAGRAISERISQLAETYPAGRKPSSNRVRKDLGAWFYRSIVDLIGEIPGPVDDLDEVIHRVRIAAQRLVPQIDERLDEVIRRQMHRVGGD